MTQTYAIVYDTSGNFFIATKNIKGYFFHNKSGGGKIYPSGFPIKNGPGLSSLPGGKLEPADHDPAIGAANEFLEETGVELRLFNINMTPEAYYNNDGETDYYGVYFQVSVVDLQTIIQSAISNINTAGNVAAEVRAGRITSYNNIFRNYPNCPQDNEQAAGMIWNLNANWPQIQALLQNQSTNWFYYILQNLKNAL